MTADPIPVIEYEAMVFGRHLASLPAGTRRRGGVLDQSAYTLLSLLQASGPASIGDLGAVTGLDASTLHRQTTGLVRSGYAERIADPEGGRARKFRLSSEGERVLTEERRASRAALTQVTSDWTDEDRSALADLLSKFNRSIEARSGRTWPRP
ncbi:MarR family winged helix-turn-helix transcriptional regulator [Nocardiopsis coralliicola]